MTGAGPESEGAPPARLGPRPLALHLQLALGAWGSAAIAAELARQGLLPWQEGLRERAAELDVERIPAGLLTARVGAAAHARMLAFLEGLRRYWTHPYRRELAEPPSIWQSGAARLLDYGPPDGYPVLVVPSLINRAYILDLAEGSSLLRFLTGQGLRPLLLDWGAPGSAERDFTLSDYIEGPLCQALDRLHGHDRRRPLVLGYCMGGLLALALARLRPRRIAGLALLATPWDFHADGLDPRRLRALMAMPASVLAALLGELPVDVLQALFAAIDPLQVPRKFVRFAALDPSSDDARTFVAVEDWLNDGVPLAGPAARDCLLGWYGDNTPARGRWRVAGRVMRPAHVRLPSLVAVPGFDRIVPPASALALAERLPGAEILRPASGHISMVVGPRAERQLWQPLALWLRRIAALHESRSPRRHA